MTSRRLGEIVAFVGMDVDAVRGVATKLDAQAQRMHEIVGSIEISMSKARTVWAGANQSHFESSWNSQYKPALGQAQGDIAALVTTLHQQSADQTTASAGSGVGGSAGAVAGSGGPSSGPGGGPGDTGTPTAAELSFQLAHPPTDLAAQKALIDQAQAAGLAPSDYEALLKQYWISKAEQDAGIDPATWDPSKGADANKATIEAVYNYYAKLYLGNKNLEWAGMANMIGPSFAGGFFDLDMIKQLADKVNDLPGPLRAAVFAATPLGGLGALATGDELQYFQTTLLQMQKSIFEDQGSLHTAYVEGGLPAITQLHTAGVINDSTYQAWQDIDSGSRTGNTALVDAGNTTLLRREQYDIIGGYYDQMRSHDGPAGEAFTYLLTAVGSASIPGAATYAQQFPLTVKENILAPGPIGSIESGLGSLVGVTPPHVDLGVQTGLPDGNISIAKDRWNLIQQNNLPTYLNLIHNHPDQAAQIIGSPLGPRIDNQRVEAQWPDIIERLITPQGVTADAGW